MSRRSYTHQQAKQVYANFGYITPPDFNHTNNKDNQYVFNVTTGQNELMSINRLRQHVRRGTKQELGEQYYRNHYPQYYPDSIEYQQYLFDQLPRLNVSNQEPKQQTGYDRWLSKQDDDIKAMNSHDQQQLYTTMQDIAKQMNRRKTFTINLDINTRSSSIGLRALLLASKIVSPRLGNINVRLTFRGDNGLIDYRHLNPNTVNYLNQLFNTDNLDDIKDSSDNPLSSYLNYHSVQLEFVERKDGKRIAAGFYPYWNNSDIDLTKYGIYSKDKCDEEQLSEPCLLTAIKNSNQVNEEQVTMIKDFIKTRVIPITCIKDIADLLHKHINIKIIYSNGKESHRDYGNEYKDKQTSCLSGSIKLYILNGHYLLNDSVNVSELYIKNYNDIHNDTRFINHPRRFLLKQYDDKRYSFSKQGISIIKTIKLMTENNLLTPMTDNDINRLSWLYKPSIYPSFNGYARPIVIHDPSKYNKNQSKHGKFFFGFDPDTVEEEQELLDELQELINGLSLRHPINVRQYYKFSLLMQKIMYEYGCYDGVVECCGKMALDIRNQCVFPIPHTYNHQPLKLSGKYYYIDLNGAYMSVITGIPNANGLMNTKIAQLIKELYRIRKSNDISPKLRTTIKYLMNSCWGYSIRKPKLIKHKHTDKIDYNLDQFTPFILKHDNNTVDIINSFVPHFSCPAFAKSVLDNYHNLMNSIRGLVNVLYENIDAILINEEDYNKLNDLGYIGNELGKFKIEHIFSEIDIRSPKRYTARDYITGEMIYH